MLLEENKPLAPFTTLGVGGPARWFAAVYSEDDIAEAVQWAQQGDIPVFALGGGSNLVISDAGFDGLVLHICLQGSSTTTNAGSTLYQVAAGENWDRFVQQTVEANCAGLECLAGIPGTVGGTPVQNVGAYGQDVSTAIAGVRVFDLAEQGFTEMEASECDFAYRQSRFNSTDKGRYIVTRVDYRLAPNGPPTLHYADLQRALPDGDRTSLVEVAKTVRQIRQSKGMLLVDNDPDCRSVGSFFKNPVVDAERVRMVKGVAGKEPPQFSAGNEPDKIGKIKLPAAWLIEQAGYSRGFVRGRTGLSSRHTLAIINRQGASATEILAFAQEIVAAVRVRFGIELQMEPERLGFAADPSSQL